MGRARKKSEALQPVQNAVTGAWSMPVRVSKSRRFARALLTEWSKLDGKSRSHMLTWTGFDVPLDVYRQIDAPARAKLTPAEAAEVAP